MRSWTYIVCVFFGCVSFTEVSGQLWGWLLPFPYRCIERPVQAYCQLEPNPSLPSTNIRGLVVFTQRTTCNRQYALQIKVQIAGMVADGNWTYHGFHVHQSADMSRGCESMGGHYNPDGSNHGAQYDPAERRHAGDLGNVVKSPRGRVQAVIFDNIATLFGEKSILGRGVVLHEKEDDLGRGGDQGSITTGNAGRRLACCTIQPL